MSARNMGHRQGLSNFATEQRIVANGVTVTDGDFVKLVQGGTITNATIGTGKLHGVVDGTDVNTLTGRTFRNTAVGNAGGTVEVLVELANDCRYLLPVDTALGATAEGSYFTLTGATGVQKVANASLSATAGQLMCVRRVADATGAYLLGIFTVSNNSTDASA